MHLFPLVLTKGVCHHFTHDGRGTTMDLIWRVNRDREASSGRLWGNGSDIRQHKLWNDADGTVPCYICFLGEIKIICRRCQPSFLGEIKIVKSD